MLLFHFKDGELGDPASQSMSVLQNAVQCRISELAPVSEYFHSGSLAKAASLSVSSI